MNSLFCLKHRISLSRPRIESRANMTSDVKLTPLRLVATYCLGAHTGAEPNFELRKITVDYTTELARVFHASSPGAASSFLSESGADQTEGSPILLARFKGEAENSLLATGFRRVYIFRPTRITPVESREEANFSYRLLRGVYPMLRLLFPNQVVRADDLAGAMVDGAVRGAGESDDLIFENRDIRAVGALLCPA